MKIVVVPGTNREGSNTLRLGRAVAARYAAQDGVEVDLLDLRTLPQGLLSPEAYDATPAGWARFADAVVGADGLHVLTPEYNGGFPGVLKLFIDHLPFPESFEHRPVCFTGLAAGRFGALSPVEQLQAIFGYRNALQYPNRVFVPGVSKALGPDGWPEDPQVAGFLENQVRGFQAFVAAVAPLR